MKIISILTLIILITSASYAQNKKKEVSLSSSDNMVYQKVSAEAARQGAMGAEIVRNEEGKIEKVIINFPEQVDNQGLENAAEQISQHQGVATVVTSKNLTTLETGNFEDFIEGQIFSNFGGPFQIPLGDLIVNGYTPDSAIKISSANSITGLSLLGSISSKSVNDVRLAVNASINQLTNISSFNWEMDVKYIPISGQGFPRILNVDVAPEIEFRLGTGSNMGQWVLLDPVNGELNTGVALTDVLHIQYSVINDIFTLAAGQALYSNSIPQHQTPEAQLRLYDAGGSHSSTWVVDNLNISILGN